MQTEQSEYQLTESDPANEGARRYTIDSKGFYIFKDGSRYKGTLNRKGKPDGKGQQLFPDDSQYEGDWLNGLQHGQGTLKFSDGGMYSGGWFRGKFSGQGIYKTWKGA